MCKNRRLFYLQKMNTFSNNFIVCIIIVHQSNAMPQVFIKKNEILLTKNVFNKDISFFIYQ